MELKGNLVDIHTRSTEPVRMVVEGRYIISIERINEEVCGYIVPPFVDSHIHIESSMLTPSEFSKVSSVHGTVGLVADPHEIANVMGKKGIRYMVKNAEQVPTKFYFGVPSCVPATDFEMSGARIDASDVEELFKVDKLHFLSEMMNYIGVIIGDADCIKKISIAKHFNKPIDGHCPKLTGRKLNTYFSSGISTDHESTSYSEAEEKLKLGMKIQVRSGSLAHDFEKIIPLIDVYPDKIMFCSDDLHPSDLQKGHINLLIKYAINKGFDIYNVLRAASLTPIEHYKLDIGCLQVGDLADFVVVDNLLDFNVLRTYIDGILVAENGETKISYQTNELVNNFGRTSHISLSDVQARLDENLDTTAKVNVIEIAPNTILTHKREAQLDVKESVVQIDEENDVLKLVNVNRYKHSVSPHLSVGFVSGFGIKNGAFASSIAHDSHNILCVGTNDHYIVKAINTIIDMKGGLVAVQDDKVLTLPLPIAGLMSDDSVENVVRRHNELLRMVEEDLDAKQPAPFMTLSFLSLSVIPSLRLLGNGLFNSELFAFEKILVQ